MINRFFLALLFAAALVLNCTAATTITLGTLAPEGTTYHRTLLELREAWRKAPGGGVNLRIYAGGKMGGDLKMVSQMRLGTLDAAMVTANGLAEIEPAVTGLQSIPMMFRTLDEVDYIGAQLQPDLEKQMEAKGFVVLFWSDAGWVHFFSKKAAETPDEMRKMKMFNWAGDAYGPGIWRSAGFQSVQLDPSEIVPMLETSVITAIPTPPFVALATQVYDRAPHMLDLNWAPLVGAMVIRKSVWDKLPADTKPVLMKAAIEAGKANKIAGRAESLKAVQAMKEKGLTVHPITPALEDAWRKTAEAVYPEFRGKIVPAETFDRVQTLLKEYRVRNGGKP